VEMTKMTLGYLIKKQHNILRLYPCQTHSEAPSHFSQIRLP